MMTTFSRQLFLLLFSLSYLVFFPHKFSITFVTQPIAFTSVGCIRKMKDHKTKLHLLVIFALLTMDVNFAFWPFLQLLLSPNEYLKNGVCYFVVSFA